MTHLDVEKGLFEELNMFQAEETKTKRVKYHAIKGKDDQVMALIGNLYFVYTESMKETMVKKDVDYMTHYNVYADIDGMYDEQKIALQQRKQMDQYVEEMFGEF